MDKRGRRNDPENEKIRLNMKAQRIFSSYQVRSCFFSKTL